MVVEEEESMGGAGDWVVDIQNKMGELNQASKESEQWTHRSIYVVPSCVKDLNKGAYRPAVVSFGPYHHGEKNLLPMEEHKQRALLHFMRRAGKPLEDFLRPMEEDLPLLMAAYERLDAQWWEGGGHRFLKLMVYDGCFMLEILRFGNTIACADYADNDPIFSQHGMVNTVPYIKRDMLMVENQIPLLVLHKLVAVESDYAEINEDTDVNRLVLRFFAPNEWHPKMADLGLHALYVFRKGLLRGQADKKKKRKKKKKTTDGGGSSLVSIRMQGGHYGGSSEIVRSATELNEAGVKLKASKSKSLRDIKFKHGILRMPTLVVDDATESMLLNLMAFERLHLGAGNEVTSYVFFMDNIIDSARDVSLLSSKKIIHNALGSDKGVAKLFNSLCKDVTLDPDNALDDVHRRVSDYCAKPINAWRANLLHTYFRSPWTFMSLAAAIFLLGLTVLQTVYTILPIYDQ